MKNRIIAAIIGMSMILTCSPAFANDKTLVSNVNDVKLEDKPSEVSFNTSNQDGLDGQSKLGKAGIKLSQSSSKKEKVKSKSNLLVADKQTTTGPAVTINDSTNTAYTINIGNVYSDTMTSEGGQRWYAFENSSIQKLTVIMQASNSTNIDYSLFLFKYNEQTNNLDLVSGSLYPNSANEQLSAIGQKGIYFIGVNSIKGFDDKNPFKFQVIPSEKYGDNEPNDNMFQAKSYDSSLSIEDTIDNNFDQDWSQFSITEASIISASLTNVSSSNPYKVDIINSQLQILRTLDAKSSDNFVLPAGTYYARIQSNGGFDAQQKYKFDLKLYGQSAILGFSPDFKYVVTTDSNKNVYINGKSVNIDWKREYNLNYPGGGYDYRSQQVSKRGDSEIIGAQYGTYTSTYTGTINHAINLIIKNPQYVYWYTHYPNGGPSTHDQINEPIPIAVSLIINADTGAVVDFNSDSFNFYYMNNIESHNFTKISK